MEVKSPIVLVWGDLFPACVGSYPSSYYSTKFQIQIESRENLIDPAALVVVIKHFIPNRDFNHTKKLVFLCVHDHKAFCVFSGIFVFMDKRSVIFMFFTEFLGNLQC